MFAKQRSFFSALMAAALTFALSFSGAVFDSPLGTAPAAEALSPCPTGWTFIVTAGPYKDYCYNQITPAAAETLTVPQGVTDLVVQAIGGGGGNGGDAVDCCNNHGYGAAGGAGGYLSATMPVLGGQVIGFYPGGKGVAGAQNYTSPAGGISTYSKAKPRFKSCCSNCSINFWFCAAVTDHWRKSTIRAQGLPCIVW